MINENSNEMNLVAFIRKLKANRKLYAIVLGIVFVITTIWIYSVPRTYTSQTALAPEAENQSLSLGGLGAIASSLGFDLSQMQNTDAISPILYPELMDDNKFVVDLLKIKFYTSKSQQPITYYDYLTKNEEKSWMENITESISHQFFPLKQPQNPFKNPYMLSKENEKLLKQIRKNINISVDRQTGVINVFATAQDPVACKMIADSTTDHLKTFIMKYRTSKAQNDVNHYKMLKDDAQKQYEEIRRKYAASADANQDVILESVRSEVENMENDMQLKYNQYQAMSTQYEESVARLREQTPVFTILQGASVPVKPSGPKRVLTILGVLLFAFFALTAGIVGRDLLKEI